VQHAAQMRSFLRSRESTSTPWVSASDPSLLDLRNLAAPTRSLMVKMIDTAFKVRTFSLHQWMQQMHTQVSLLVHGRPGTGKSPLCMAVGAAVGACHVAADGSRGRLFRTTTLEGIPRNTLKSGDVLFYDEMHPLMKKSNKEVYSIDDWKTALDSIQPGSIDGKGSNGPRTGAIVFEANTTKIAAYNYESPHGWFHQIPANLFEMSPSEISVLDIHVLAILKRVSFLHLQASIIPAAAVVVHQQAATSSVSEEFARLDGGENEIP
jgi:hypothetical protein